MSELKQRFDAIQDRVNEIEKKVRAGGLSKEEKKTLINETVQCMIAVGHIALEKMQMEQDNEIRH